MSKACCLRYLLMPRWNISPRQVGGWQRVLLQFPHACLSLVSPCSFSPLWSGKSQAGGPRRQDRASDLLVPLAGPCWEDQPAGTSCWRALQSFKQNKSERVSAATRLSPCTLLYWRPLLSALLCWFTKVFLVYLFVLFPSPDEFITGVVYNS